MQHLYLKYETLRCTTHTVCATFDWHRICYGLSDYRRRPEMFFGQPIQLHLAPERSAADTETLCGVPEMTGGLTSSAYDRIALGGCVAIVEPRYWCARRSGGCGLRDRRRQISQRQHAFL